MTLRTKPIDSLGLFSTVTKKLKLNGVNTVGDLLDMKASEIMMMPGLGLKSRNDIRNVLKEKGLWFTYDIELHNKLFSNNPVNVCKPKSDDSAMSLRDYFAAKAMAAVLPAVMNELKKTRGSVKEAQRLQSLSAETCYVLADAMLKARDGTG